MLNINNPTIKGWALVTAAFMLVFAFSTVDHAISPLVAVLEAVFSVTKERVLWLISYCTLGIIVGLFMGPQLLKAYRAPRILAASTLLMLVGLALFLTINSFWLALVFRFMFGLGAGFLSTIMWWLAYESIDKKFYTPMITVLTASRPMAVAAGVPLVMYSGATLGWNGAFAATGVLILIFAIIFAATLPIDSRTATAFNLTNILNTYKIAFKTPHLKTFFTAMFINRICYFGFYSLLGIWFIDNYKLSTIQLAKPLIIIGICETAINFIVPFMMKIGQKKLFYIAAIINIIVFSFFIWGKLSIGTAIMLIALFAMTDRIYSMLLLIFIPSIFNKSTDRTTIGSLVTLISWGSLAVISYIEGSFLHTIGLNPLAGFLILSLVAGIILYLKVLNKTVFAILR